MFEPPMDRIYLVKKQLTEAIIDNNYDLQSPEILVLSTQLDLLMLPLFESQLTSHTATCSFLRHHAMRYSV